MRVDADRSPDVALALGEPDHLAPFACARGNVEHRGHARRARALERRGLLLGQALIVEVTVAVGEHGGGHKPESPRDAPGDFEPNGTTGGRKRKPLHESRASQRIRLLSYCCSGPSGGDQMHGAHEWNFFLEALLLIIITAYLGIAIQF